MILLNIPMQQRQGEQIAPAPPGSYEIAPDAVGDTLVLTLELTNADIIDPARSFDLRIEAVELLPDGTLGGFIPWSSLTFQCGPQHNPNSPTWEAPMVVSGVPASRRVRAILNCPVRTRIGGKLELL
jgi:hypothetical protein